MPDGRLLASLDARSAEKQGGVEAALDGFDALRIDLVAVKQDLLAAQMELFLRRVGTARLGAWVVNTPEDIARWRAAPVGVITTDRPDLFGLKRA